MNFWLMKSEPDVFSIDDLKKQKKSGWDGVRNYQARNFMRDQMRKGDRIFFYHSNATPPGIAGVAEVSKESYPDPTQFDPQSKYYDSKATKEKPIWYMVEVAFLERFTQLLSLEELKKTKTLHNMLLLRKGNRLSVMPVQEKEWKIILSLTK